jgi:hypothetical protein
MKTVIAVAALALLAGCAGNDSGGGKTGTADTKGKAGAYDIRGTQVEACECNSVCPCLFNEDVSYDQCQGWLGMSVSEGSYEGTDLAGTKFVVALVKTGKNIAKDMGHWEGIVWTDEGATEAQRAGIKAILTKEFGPAFAKIDFRFTKISWMGGDDHFDVKVGTIGEFKITAMKNADGKVTHVDNAPSPLALPVYNCAKSDMNTFADGAVKWDYAGRNGGYGPFELKSK